MRISVFSLGRAVSCASCRAAPKRICRCIPAREEGDCTGNSQPRTANGELDANGLFRRRGRTAIDNRELSDRKGSFFRYNATARIKRTCCNGRIHRQLLRTVSRARARCFVDVVALTDFRTHGSVMFAFTKKSRGGETEKRERISPCSFISNIFSRYQQNDAIDNGIAKPAAGGFKIQILLTVGMKAYTLPSVFR